MARNYIQPGDTLTVTATAAAVSGAVVEIGSIVGVALSDAATGDPLDVKVTGVFDLPKVGADDMATGDPVFWDATASLVTIDATGNARVGTAVKPAGSGVATVAVRLVSV